jgi:hypothetical protein
MRTRLDVVALALAAERWRDVAGRFWMRTAASVPTQVLAQVLALDGAVLLERRRLARHGDRV